MSVRVWLPNCDVGYCIQFDCCSWFVSAAVAAEGIKEPYKLTVSFEGVKLVFSANTLSYFLDLLASVDLPFFLDLLPNSRTRTLLLNETDLSGELASSWCCNCYCVFVLRLALRTLSADLCGLLILVWWYSGSYPSGLWNLFGWTLAASSQSVFL